MQRRLADIAEQERKMIHDRCQYKRCHLRTRMAVNYVSLFLLTSLAAQAAQAGSLGRLFFTPEQRAQLDDARARNAAAEEGTSSVLAVNGIVQKQGGGRTVWINGVAQNAGNSDERSPEAVPVAVPGKSQPVKIKVGQRLLLDQPAQQNQPAPGR